MQMCRQSDHHEALGVSVKNVTKLELTWVGKEKRPNLEPRVLIEDPEKSYHSDRYHYPNSFEG